MRLTASVTPACWWVLDHIGSVSRAVGFQSFTQPSMNRVKAVSRTSLLAPRLLNTSGFILRCMQAIALETLLSQFSKHRRKYGRRSQSATHASGRVWRGHSDCEP